MKAFKTFELPFYGLKEGLHQFDFQVSDEFFRNFPDSIIEKGRFFLKIELLKASSFAKLNLEYQGYMITDCDRCLNQIHLPLSGNNELLFKYSMEKNQDDGDIVYISRDIDKLNIAKYIYDFISLSIPLIKVYDCVGEKNPPCNMEVLDKMEDEGMLFDNPLALQLKDIGLIKNKNHGTSKK